VAHGVSDHQRYVPDHRREARYRLEGLIAQGMGHERRQVQLEDIDLAGNVKGLYHRGVNPTDHPEPFTANGYRRLPARLQTVVIATQKDGLQPHLAQQTLHRTLGIEEIEGFVAAAPLLLRPGAAQQAAQYLRLVRQIAGPPEIDLAQLEEHNHPTLVPQVGFQGGQEVAPEAGAEILLLRRHGVGQVYRLNSRWLLECFIQ